MTRPKEEVDYVIQLLALGYTSLRVEELTRFNQSQISQIKFKNITKLEKAFYCPYGHSNKSNILLVDSIPYIACSVCKCAFMVKYCEC